MGHLRKLVSGAVSRVVPEGVITNPGFKGGSVDPLTKPVSGTVSRSVSRSVPRV